MAYGIGVPSLKLNNAGNVSKSCGDFGAVAAEALEERSGRDSDIDKAKAMDNEYVGLQTAAELLAYSDKHCAELRDAKGRGIRSDAVRMCATVFKPAAAYMNTLSQEQQRVLLQDCVSFLSGVVGRENIKSQAFHFDELGAHVHCFWEPMTDDGRLCAKEVHSLKFFGRINKDLPAHLRSKGWDIADADCYDEKQRELEATKTEVAELEETRRKRGRSSATFKSEAEAEKLSLLKEIDSLQDQREQLHGELDQLETKAEELREQIPDWPTYDRVATQAWNALDHFKQLLQEVFNKGLIFRNRKGERAILEAVDGIRDFVMTTIAAMRGFEARESVPEARQRSRVISQGLDDMIATAEAQKAPERLSEGKRRREER